MTEFHARYGYGVMIYWHVERGQLCVHSQLKSCSSSEVAAMIEGLLRHGTNADTEDYTHTYGASLVGFAFTELLASSFAPAEEHRRYPALRPRSCPGRLAQAGEDPHEAAR